MNSIPLYFSLGIYKKKRNIHKSAFKWNNLLFLWNKLYKAKACFFKVWK